MNVLLTVLFKSSVLCSFASEVSALGIINNRFKNSETSKEYFGVALYCGFSMCRNLYDLDVSLWLSMKQRSQSS